MKKKMAIVSLLVCVCVAFAVLTAACGAETVKTDWQIDAHATVTAEGFDALPGSVEKGVTVTFSVTCAEGYEVDTVKVNDRAVGKKDGNYKFVASEDATVVVTTKLLVSGVKVTTKPDDLLYFDGESFDKAGMVVEVTYADGSKKAVTDYTVSPTVFSGGDTSFTVSYGGKSDTVELTAPVEYLVTIDPVGGTISPALLAEYGKQHNYAVDAETGVVKFSYLTLAADILLPTAEDITKENYSLLGWTDNATVIEAGSKTNVAVKAKWEPMLVSIARLYFDVREETADGKTVQVPYLIIDGRFLNAESAYLYLYEGNDDVSMKGTEVTRAADTDAFELLFDLRDLSSPKAEEGQEPTDYKGKWMDIRFNATMGEKEESQQIYIPTAGLDVDPTQRIICGDYVYSFATYNNDAGTTLKVLYNDYQMSYTATIDDEVYGEGTEPEPVLTIAGTLNDAFVEGAAGGKFGVSFFNGGETEIYTSDIGANNAFSIKIPLSAFPLDTDAFAHMYVIDADGNTVRGGSSTNLPVTACTTTFGKTDIDFAAANAHDAANNFTYYVGYKWDGLMVKVKDKRVVFDKLSLKEEDGKAYMVFEGTTLLTAADFTAEGTAAQFAPAIQELNTWTVTKFADRVVTVADGRFTIVCEITDMAASENVYYFKYVPFDGGQEKDLPTSKLVEQAQTVTVGGKTFRLAHDNVSDWGKRSCLTIAAQ